MKCPHCGNELKDDAKFCDKCGAELAIRADDAPETVSNRLAVYHRQTEPLTDYYEKLGKLKVIDGTGDVRETTRLVFAAIEE